ncbi:MAG: apolipoprotein N-acyltransferase [Pseudomonadota bacterium]|nr:apolipoprotein N-acyltransferase [Pseudomonadota bacterium]
MNKKFKRFLPILTGILIGTSFIPFYPWAIFFAWIPLWTYWLENPTPKKVFFSGWVCQFVLTLIGFHWITRVASEFGDLPWILALLALLAFAAFSNLQVAVSGWIWSKLHNKYSFSKPQSIVVIAFLLIILEYVFPMIFPWNMGYTWFYANWPAYQWADVFGFQGLSALSILFNACVALSLERRKLKISNWWVPVGVAALIFVGLNLTGNTHASPWRLTDEKTNVLQIQANIGNFQKIAAEKQGMFKYDILNEYMRISKLGLEQHPDTNMVIWPETAIPEYLDDHNLSAPYATLVRNQIRELARPLATGAYSIDFGKNDSGVYNGLFYFNEQAELVAPPYRKHVLLAFGEYFPGAEMFPFLKDLIPAVSDFRRGPGPQVTHFLNTEVGSQVCYEGLFPEITRGLVDLGARLIVNVTNDSWYDFFSEPRQHMYMTLGRAVEFRRPLIRTTNTGISTGVLADGSILAFSKLNEPIFQYLEVSYQKNPEKTFFARFGQYYPLVLILAFVILLITIRTKTGRLISIV